MKKLPKISIQNKGSVTKVYVDGKELEGVISIDFSHVSNQNNGFPVLKIEMLSSQILLETACVPELPEIYEPFYISKEKLINAGILNQEESDSL